jgi:hypothetical protein
MQIGQGAQWTKIGHPVVVLLWDLPCFASAAGNRLMWLSVPQKQSTLHYG